MTLDQFRKTQKVLSPSDDELDTYIYNKYWFIYEVANGNNIVYSTLIEEFSTIEEAEEALYQMYCDEDKLTEGY